MKRHFSSRRAFASLRGFAAVLALGLGLAPVCASCSLGEGQGAIQGQLNVPNCWSGHFELAPDFFAGIPYRETLQLRIQRGGDFQTFSDGLVILVDDVHEIRPEGENPGHLGQALEVSLPPEVTPPGVPVKAVSNPASVHVTLYLQRTCRTQNVALYALDTVMLNSDGSCDALPDGGEEPRGCPSEPPSLATTSDAGTNGVGTDAGAAAATSNPLGHSEITFNHLFNGNPEETNATERLTEGSLNLYFVDPRDICAGGLGPPPRCRGHLTGNFRFYFERGRPGQPFP